MKALFFSPLFVCIFLLLHTQSLSQNTEAYIASGDSLYGINEFGAALNYYLQAEPLIKKDSGEYSHAYARFADQYVGFTYEKTGDYAQAKKWYEKSVGVYRAIHWAELQDYDYGEAIINLGNLYNIFGAYSEAALLLDTGRRIFKDVPLTVTPAFYIATNGYANSLNMTGENAKAAGIYENILQQLQQMLGSNQNEPCASVQNNLAACYAKLGKYNKAIDYSHKAVNYFKNAGVPFAKQYIETQIVLIGVFYMSGSYDSALYYCKKAISAADSLEDKYEFAAFANVYAEAIEQKGKMKEAEQLFIKALSFEKSIDSLPTNIYYALTTNLALLYNKIGRYAKADTLFSLLIEKANKIRKPQYTYYDGIYYGYCTNAIAQKKYKAASDAIEVLNKETVQFINTNFSGLSEDEKLNFLSTLYKNFDLQCTLAGVSKNLPASFLNNAYQNILLIKGLVLESQEKLFRKISDRNDENLKNIFQQWRLNAQVLDRQYSLDENMRLLNADSLEQERTTLEKQMSSYFKGDDLFSFRNTSAINKTSTHLKNGEALIEFVRYNYINPVSNKDSAAYAAFITKYGDTTVHFIPLCSEGALLQLMKKDKLTLMAPNQLVKVLYPDMTAGKLSASETNIVLYKLIWNPIQAYLGNTKTVYYSAAGLLNNISFNAISDGAKGLLMDNYNLYAVFSTGSLPAANTSSVKINAISIWSNMDYNYSAISSDTAATNHTLNTDKKIQWKNFSASDADTLKKIFMAANTSFTVFEKDAATEDSFKTFSSNFSGVLHIATHGAYTPEENSMKDLISNKFTAQVNPLLRCKLVFSGANTPQQNKDDGILNGYEISQLDLSKVQLITLSACETGLGDIKGYEGVFGLQRAFKMAGAKKMVLSLWRVPAAQTKDLMSGFYTKWLAGSSMHDALTETQKEMQKKYSPFYWAGFILVE